MIQKTKDYDIFKFRSDNREAILQTHIARLKESIRARNLLEFRPIIVNADMEVLDGQHRLLAARSLGVDIYYQIAKNINPEDIIPFNVAKSWGIGDYLNYYVKNGYPEYRKLKDWMDKHQLKLKIALKLTMGSTDKAMEDYRHGRYVFLNEYEGVIEECWKTIDYIKRMNGTSQYTGTSKFWSPLVKLIMHGDFDAHKWRQNLERMIDKFGPRVNSHAFAQLFTEVYNWRNTTKIDVNLL